MLDHASCILYSYLEGTSAPVSRLRNKVEVSEEPAAVTSLLAKTNAPCRIVRAYMPHKCYASL